jgi:uncharacterized protein (TIGR03083 family)
VAEVKSWDVAVDRGVIDLREPFAAVQDELIMLLAGLSSGDWSEPTVLPGWDVLSVALHLLGGDLGRLSCAWAGQQPGSSQAFAELTGQIEADNEQWVAAARRVPPPLVVEFLRLTAPRASALFSDADLWSAGTPVGWTGSGPSPLWLDIAREYTERWMHQAQIREAVGAQALEARQWLGPVLDVLLLSLPRTYGSVEAPAGTTVAVELTGPAGGVWQLARDAQRWRLGHGAARMPDASISLSAHDAWRRLARLTPREALEDSVSATGNEGLWRPALDAVAVMTTSS